MELYNKFLILKTTDIDEALSPCEHFLLRQIIQVIRSYRASEGKPENKYVVINQDEPYFSEVLKLMEKESPLEHAPLRPKPMQRQPDKEA